MPAQDRSHTSFCNSASIKLGVELAGREDVVCSINSAGTSQRTFNCDEWMERSLLATASLLHPGSAAIGALVDSINDPITLCAGVGDTGVFASRSFDPPGIAVMD